MKYTVKLIGHLFSDGKFAKWDTPDCIEVDTKTPRAAAQKALDSLSSFTTRCVCEVEGKRYLGTPVHKMHVTSWKEEV